MELVSHISKPRSLSAIDLICMLLVGLGIGVFAMYCYLSDHPEAVRRSQTTIMVVPQKANDQPGAGKVLTQQSLKTEQF